MSGCQNCVLFLNAFPDPVDPSLVAFLALEKRLKEKKEATKSSKNAGATNL